MEFLQPVLAVTQEEMEHVIFSVIETEAVPSGMFVTVTFIEELIGVAGEVTESFDFILDGVAVDYIHYDGESHLMSGID